uniref:PPM-type phosphatase domain-containing protein n=1 Tax=Guillardia theta TaxID=55529 RepID=A0A7S4NUM3_GUITH|mmetsp:Transcript_32910/g.104059  ORF Transcript_32910/g.104059 Transcript_32910/m.104059 type:complete len:404 (+) Transcript_32910:233-1444(+)
MGSYLSSPVKDKESHDGSGIGGIKYGLSAMQGWRTNMEDAHIACGNVGKQNPLGIFGVFDGHGGREVAQFVSKHFQTEFEGIVSNQQGKVEPSLPIAFHRMDAMLREQKYAAELISLSSSPKSSQPDSPTSTSAASTGTRNQDAPRIGNASQERAVGLVRSSINSSLEDARKKGKLTQKEAMELMVKMMALQRMEKNALASSQAVQQGTEGSNKLNGCSEEATCAGCTANVVVLTAKEIFVANAGDSRSVLCRKGQAVPLSEDHKPNNPKERSRITSAGGWVSEAANGHFRVNGNLNLSRSIGDLKYKSDSKLPPSKQVITAEPDVRRIPRTEEDEFIITACDGVWDCMSNQQLVDFVRARLKSNQVISKICEDIFEKCISVDPKQTQGIGGDNMTCIIIKLK